MKAGTTIREFYAKGKRRVILRTPRWEDLDDLFEMINSLVKEKADIVMSEKVTKEEETDWLAKALSNLEKEEVFYLVAEADGKVVANSEIGRARGSYERHVGGIGIAIREGFRDIGIGTEMMKTSIRQARVMDLKVLRLSAFESNKRAIHVYERVGFVQTGRIPQKFFKEGKYIDEVIIAMLLKESQ